MLHMAISAQGDQLDVGTYNPVQPELTRGGEMATGTARPAASSPAAPTLTPAEFAHTRQGVHMTERASAQAQTLQWET